MSSKTLWDGTTLRNWPSTAINLFYRQIVAHRGLPFEVKLPNAKARKSMRDAQSGRGLIRGKTVDELAETLDAGPPPD